MATVALKAITKNFPGGSQAVAGIDLTVADGEILAILGPSGSGKSTLLKLIAGLDSPSSGTIEIGGRNMAGVAPSLRNASLVFQNQVPYPHLNVFENLAFGLRARRVGKAEIVGRVEEIAASLRISNLLGRKPSALSGGEKQRVTLGRALVGRPSVLLLDEPFSNLDTPLRTSLRGELAMIQQKSRITTILVTHDQAEALALGQQVAVMDSGRISQKGTPTEVYQLPANRFVGAFVGDPPMNFVSVQANRQKVKILPDGPSWSEFKLPLHDQETSLWMGIRPELVHLDETGSSDLIRLPAIVERVEVHGPDQVLTLRIGEETWIARSRWTTDRKVGSAASVSFDPRLVAYFDPATGRRFQP